MSVVEDVGSLAQSPRVLLGVMSNPTSQRLRGQLRDWHSRFAAHRRGDVAVRYVFGSSFYNATSEPPPEAVSYAHSESEHADLLFVDGRERLPHVGVVTEKSAAFWREIVSKEPGYAFYCKCDDDTMVHLDRLHRVLWQALRAEGPHRPIYFGHMKWRGWDEGYHFQACGGSWGGAGKTKQDILFGGPVDLTKPHGAQYPPCPNAAGPYPYMSGGMVCMSNALARIMAADRAFGDFLTVAKARNDHGVRCKRPRLCAAQAASVHMWHHEDAGIGFNVFRAVVSANASASIIPTPGHFNDPGIIERSPSAQDSYWSSRALFVHGIKKRAHYNLALQRWTLGRSSDHLTLDCDRNCTAHRFPAYGWDWARLPCPRPSWNQPQPGHWCDVDPARHYRCCNWPWVVPALREALLATLASARSQRLTVSQLTRRARAAIGRAARDGEACSGACARVEVPGWPQIQAVLEDLQQRGDIGYSAERDDRGDVVGRGESAVWLIGGAAAVTPATSPPAVVVPPSAGEAQRARAALRDL